MPTTVFSIDGVQYQVDETARHSLNPLIVLRGGNKYWVIIVIGWNEPSKEIVYGDFCLYGKWRPTSHTAKWAIASYLQDTGHQNVFVAQRSK